GCDLLDLLAQFRAVRRRRIARFTFLRHRNLLSLHGQLNAGRESWPRHTAPEGEFNPGSPECPGAVSLSAGPLSENAADQWPPRGGIRLGGATADLRSLSGKVGLLAPGRDHLRGVLGGDAIDLGAETAGLRRQHA